MTQKEKLYIMRILTEEKAEQQRLIGSVACMDGISEQTKKNTEEILINNINAIDKAIELLDK